MEPSILSWGKDICQPPYSNPPVLSSSRPPGACITPSNVMNVVVIILRILRLYHKGRFSLPLSTGAEKKKTFDIIKFMENKKELVLERVYDASVELVSLEGLD